MNRIQEEIVKRLFALRDMQYQVFQCKLIPTVPSERIIGVRTPVLRQYAKELARRGVAGEFLAALPHWYFDENQLHALILSLGKDYEATLANVDAFLPYVDNWATCDQLSPRVFCRHRSELRNAVWRWLTSEHPYTVRFGVVMLMRHFLDEDFFDPAYLAQAAALQSENYYVSMGIAWFFATALSKQWDATLPYIEQRQLDSRTHNKVIQKAMESYRVPDDRKEYLRSLKNYN